MITKPEILAPAGNFETFISAVEAGADAVYLGLKDFSARAKAKNFSYAQLHRICTYAKSKNVRIFVALNTLVKQQEMPRAFRTLEMINAAGADAVIVQDLGIASIAKKYFPNLALHASTQLAIHNSLGVIQAEKFGFKRVVLARELSFEQIKTIKNKTTAELEIFCHGALCFCVSGMCLFSSFVGGNSGNRGHCMQPCRRLWNVNSSQGYFLSPKDLQLADYIAEIKNAGIASLKIEGRLKSPDYVYKTVTAYRMLVDAPENKFADTLKKAKEILAYDYARQKTLCNFAGNSDCIFEPEKSKSTGIYIGKIKEKTSTGFTVDGTLKIKEGDTLRIVDCKNDKSSIVKVDKIVNDVICCDGIYMQSGFEVYKTAEAQNLSKNINDDILKDETDFKEPQHTNLHIPKIKTVTTLSPLFIRINNFQWLNIIKSIKASTIIKLTKNNILNIADIQLSKDFYFELPAYIDENDIELFTKKINLLLAKGCNKFFVNNISHFVFFENKKAELFAGQSLYTLNNYTADFLMKYSIKAFAVSWEDDLTNIFAMSQNTKQNRIVFLSGFPELVFSKMKFLKQIQNKVIKSGPDEFKTVSSDNSDVIIPKFPIQLFSIKNQFIKAGISSFAIDLSYVPPDKNYLNQILSAYNGQAHISSANIFNFKRQLK